MPLKVLHITVSPVHADRISILNEGMLKVDQLFQLKRATVKAPKNGEGEIHGQLRREINTLEARIHEIIFQLKYVAPAEKEEGEILIISKKHRGNWTTQYSTRSQERWKKARADQNLP
jgi:hypothetical protein